MSAGGCRSGTPARSSRSALGDPEADPGSRCDAAPHAPPRTSLRVPRLLTRRLAPALAKGHTSHVSLGRLEPSELLPHPSGAVTPDVALRSALSSPLLRSTRRQQAERRAVRRYVRALQRCMRGTNGRIPGFTCQHKTKCILFK